ncbi:hypothetical protein PM082_014463 [Marasmius tenuissimus]|nr:hypothetical protein PM082_014463 [Marasmius tenuissimus]
MTTLQEAIALALDSNRSIASCQVAGATLIVFDTLLTLNREIHLIWASPWSLVKAVYLIQRYLPFIDTVVLNTYWYLGLSQDPSTCSHLQNVIAWMGWIGILLSEGIPHELSRLGRLVEKPIYENYAMYGVRWSLYPVRLSLLTIPRWSPVSVASGLPSLLNRPLMVSSRLLDIQPPPSIKDIGCLDIPTNNLLYVCWACLAGYDTAAFIMMIMPLARAYHQGETARMTRLIYEDGIKYYALLFLSSLLNIIIVTTRKDLLYLLTMYAPLTSTPLAVYPDTNPESASEGFFIPSLQVA